MNLPSAKTYSWTSIAALCIGIGGCAGSKPAVIPLNLTSNIRGPISLMPFNTNFDRKYYSDAHLRGKALLEILIVQAINKRSGLYTYTFDDKDLKNLRASIINSLEATNHFGAVNDIFDADAGLPVQGNRLYIDFESMGVSQKFRFICEIKARAKITTSREEVLAEKDIQISETGTMTLSAAKNKAIEKFILEISILLNSI